MILWVRIRAQNCSYHYKKHVGWIWDELELSWFFMCGSISYFWPSYQRLQPSSSLRNETQFRFKVMQHELKNYSKPHPFSCINKTLSKSQEMIWPNNKQLWSEQRKTCFSVIDFNWFSFHKLKHHLFDLSITLSSLLVKSTCYQVAMNVQKKYHEISIKWKKNKVTYLMLHQ